MARCQRQGQSYEEGEVTMKNAARVRAMMKRKKDEKKEESCEKGCK